MNNIIYGFVRLSDEPTRCYYLKDCSEVVNEIVGLEVCDILNIAGLGRLQVESVTHQTYENEYEKNDIYHIYDIFCNWLHDAMEVT